MMTPSLRTLSIMLASGLAAALGGCMNPMNDRSYVGVDPQAVELRDDLPYDSGRGLNRSQWAATTIHVPVDGTAHRPTYNSNRRYAKGSARQRSEYPTAETSLELGAESLGEVPVQIGSAAVDAISIPVGLVVYHQANTRWSPDASYERTPSAPAAAPSLPPMTDQPASVAPAASQPTAQPTSEPTSTPASAPRPMGRMTPVAPSETQR